MNKIEKIRDILNDYDINDEISSEKFILQTKQKKFKLKNISISDNIELNSNKNPITQVYIKKNNDTEEKNLKNLSVEAAKLNSISEIYDYLKNSNFCKIKELSKNTVLYDGKINAQIILIGEAPGEDEDINGVPFCGRSGRLLDNMLTSIGLSRQKNLYITNTVFWRPPANRKPTRDEILNCKSFLMRQIEIIEPKLIILCGGTSIESVLEIEEVKISEYRGKISILNNKYKCISIYHPSYLLRSPSAKKNAWTDMCFIRDFITNNNINL